MTSTGSYTRILPPDDEEIDFLQSFHYVTRENINTSVTLEDGHGEDIHEWLSMLADNYELVEKELSIMYRTQNITS